MRRWLSSPKSLLQAKLDKINRRTEITDIKRNFKQLVVSTVFTTSALLLYMYMCMHTLHAQILLYRYNRQSMWRHARTCWRLRVVHWLQRVAGLQHDDITTKALRLIYKFCNQNTLMLSEAYNAQVTSLIHLIDYMLATLVLFLWAENYTYKGAFRESLIKFDAFCF